MSQGLCWGPLGWGVWTLGSYTPKIKQSGWSPLGSVTLGPFPAQSHFCRGLTTPPSRAVREGVHGDTRPRACPVDGPRCLITYYYIVRGVNSIRTNPH